VATGDFALVLPDHEQVFGYVRRRGDASLLVLANLSSAPATYDAEQLAEWQDGELVLANLRDAAPSPTGSLAPWEAVVYAR
jgi:oligo-1,6-glucosidase